MNIAFRVDSSSDMGSGHLARCLAMANFLSNQGAQCVFFTKSLPGNFNESIYRNGHKAILLPLQPNWRPTGVPYVDWLGSTVEWDARHFNQAMNSQIDIVFDWIVVDHYGLDADWENHVSHQSNGMIVIDDLANRRHEATMLLDPTYSPNMYTRYQKLVNTECELLLGPEYIFLRDEFYQARPSVSPPSGILVFFGGVDHQNMTGRVLPAVIAAAGDRIIRVILGASNPHAEALIDRWEGDERVVIFCDVDNMAEHLSQSELAIGAGGVSIWERLFLRVKSITYSTVPNQTIALEALAHDGYLLYLGNLDDYSEAVLHDSIVEQLKNPGKIKEMKIGGGGSFLWQRLQSN